ncbi:MAG: NAD-dependent epimerase/dehydratase family protein [Kiritimatiellia bacterium]
MKVIILGGKGFVGSALVNESQRRGLDTVCVDLENYSSLAGTRGDVLINANGNSRKYLAEQEPLKDFELSVLSVARSFHDFPAAYYVYLSSIDIYPDVSNPAHNSETAPIDVAKISTYGFHKYLAEQLVLHHSRSWLIIRMGGFVGEGLWKNSIYDLLKGRSLRVDPDSAYQYLNTRDLARIVFSLVQEGIQGEIFNVAGDGTVRLREVASWIPGCSPRTDPTIHQPPCEHYEINIEKIKHLYSVPRTAETVKTFVDQVLSGRARLR